MGLDQNCTSNSTNKGASMINYVTDPNTYQTPSGNETLLKQWVAEVGTISVCVYVSSKLYKSGKHTMNLITRGNILYYNLKRFLRYNTITRKTFLGFLN